MAVLNMWPGSKEPFHCIETSHRPPVYCQDPIYIRTIVNYLGSSSSPERNYPIVFSYWCPVGNPPKAIFYNIEQLTREDELERVLYRIHKSDIQEVWDYSKANVDILKSKGISAKYVPFTLPIPEILRYRSLHSSVKTHDVVFMGSQSPYRNRILDELEEKGIRVVRIINTYDEKERDILIGKATLLINIHYGPEYKIFERQRCEPWIASGFPVISEESLDTDPRCIHVPYESLVETVCNYLSSKPKV